MEVIKQQISEIVAAWSEVYPKMRDNPALWQPHLPNASAEQINEVVSTLETWFGRVQVPGGFKPVFHVASALVATALPNLVTSVRSLQRAEYNFLPSFISGLNQLLSALHSMVVYSSRSYSRQALGDVFAEMQQGLALLNTAQVELGAKMEVLRDAAAHLGDAEQRSNAIDGLQVRAEEMIAKATKDLETLLEKSESEFDKAIEKAGGSVENILAAATTANEKFLGEAELRIKAAHDEIELHRKAVDDKRKEIEERREALKTLEEQSGDLLQRNSDLQLKLEEHKMRLEKMEHRSGEQQKLISDLLPKGASAALASAFEVRAGQLDLTKWVWGVVFVLSIAGLLGITAWLAVEAKSGQPDVWKELAQRLPYAAPLIWLGWFSAIQYGNTIRVQEDYAFKAATSKAFAGYKDHMDYMASVQLGEAKTAMTMLAARTIEILAHEPLRIYDKTAGDVSPSSSLRDMFDRATTRKAAKPPETKA